MGFANVRAGTQKYYDLSSTRPNISESHSEISTRVRFCIVAGRPHLMLWVSPDGAGQQWVAYNLAGEHNRLQASDIPTASVPAARCRPLSISSGI